VNATLSSPLPDGATRQRQNLGAARILGTDFELEWRPLKPLSLVAGYEYVSPTVTSNPSAPELVGKDLAQDPRHRAILQAGFESERYFTGTLQLRWVGPQFEDDLNAQPMAGYLLVDAFASRDIAGGLSVFGAVENLFNREYVVGRAGVDTIGAPRTFRAGLRFRY
ncbi:MAG: TonB-dependent receptor domain-containing protein, partial [Myxococcaceae bacterium]